MGIGNYQAAVIPACARQTVNPGALPAASLEKVIQAVQELDMDEVRDKIAARKGTGR
jgi:hypothetical protein